MNKRRLDGKKKLVATTAQMTADMRSYCLQKGIESESEFIRQAIAHYIGREFDDNTLALSVLKDTRESLSQLRDMVSILFSYVNFMHLNLIGYHPELPEDVKKSAYASAQNRHDRFFASFQKRLKDDPHFFERILHTYVTGALDG